MIDLAPIITVVLAFGISIACTLGAVYWVSSETKQHIDESVGVLIKEIRQGRDEVVSEAHEIAKDAEH